MGARGRALAEVAENFLERAEHSRKLQSPLHRVWKYLEQANAARVFGIAFVISLLAGFTASILSRSIIGGEGHDGYL